MRFSKRALLKVYLEETDLARLTTLANAEHSTVAEYTRNLILERLNEVSIPVKISSVDVPMSVEDIQRKPTGKEWAAQIPTSISVESHLPPVYSRPQHDPRCPCAACKKAQSHEVSH